MKEQQVAYLIQGDGAVSDIVTEELLVALDQLVQGNTMQGQSVASNGLAVYGFLQALKRAMRATKSLSPETHKLMEDE